MCCVSVWELEGPGYPPAKVHGDGKEVLAAPAVCIQQGAVAHTGDSSSLRLILKLFAAHIVVFSADSR
jgi:hypothetical protein